MATSEEIAWAAGLFEGEGCFSTMGQPGVHGRQNARAMVCMTDRATVERFAQIVGMGTVYVDGMKRRGSRRHLTVWQTTTADDFRAVVGLLWDWLSPRRQGRATELLEGLNKPVGKPWASKPEAHQRKRLSSQQKAAIRRSRSPYRVLADRYGIAYSTVARIVQSDPNWTDRRRTF